MTMDDTVGYPVIEVIALYAAHLITGRACRHRHDIVVGPAGVDSSTIRCDVR
jgi:hypothetical protein